MRLFLSRLHFPVTTLGPGRRVGIWFQGCSLRCPGCISRDTWAHGRGETTVEEVMNVVKPWLAAADGVTVSGGEPFEQIRALEALLTAVRAEIGSDKDVLVYSGLTWDKILPLISTWQGLVDAVMSEPFVRTAPQTRIWRGSDNQRLHLLTELGLRRYSDWLDAGREALPKALDVCFENDTVWMAGIPEKDSLALIQKALGEAGFLSSVSEAEVNHPYSLPVFA